MNKLNTFPALITPFLLIFLSNFCNTDEVDLVANLGKTSLAKEPARFNNTFLFRLPTILPRNPPG